MPWLTVPACVCVCTCVFVQCTVVRVRVCVCMHVCTCVFVSCVGLGVRLLPGTLPAGRDLLSKLDTITTYGCLHACTRRALLTWCGVRPCACMRSIHDDGVSILRDAGLHFSVREVAWDATGERLAVAFAPPVLPQHTKGVRSAVKHGERAIVLYAVRQYPALEFDMRYVCRCGCGCGRVGMHLERCNSPRRCRACVL